MANTNIYRVPSSNGNRRLFCFSAWIKLTGTTGERTLFSAGADSDVNGYFNILIGGDHHLYVEYYQGGYQHVYTNAKYRDCNSWYHIMVQVAAGEGTASNRIKMYVNGEQITSLGSTDYPSSDYDFKVNQSGETQSLGRARNSSGGSHNYFDGVMSHVHMVDGAGGSGSGGVCLPTDFGSVDSTTGEWKINTSPSVTYGTNGFFMFKNNNSLTDQSGKGNNFTANGGTLTKTEDCPDNVFATMNPLDNYYFTGTFSNGNNTVVTNNSLKAWSTSTIGMTSGKYYYEAKNSATGGSTPTDDWNRIGITDRSATSNSDIGATANQYVLTQYNGSKYVNGTNSTYASSWSTGDIIGCAIDLDNNKIYWHKNGQWGTGSGAWGSTTFNSSTGAVTIVAPSSTLNGFYFVGVGDAGSSVSKTWQFNFGNGTFGTTAVSSAGTNASGNGIFEYDVPTNYTALSTKGLNI